MFSSDNVRTHSEGVAGARIQSAWTPERERRAVRLYLVEGFTAAEVEKYAASLKARIADLEAQLAARDGSVQHRVG